jgi:hypothetical protein
MCLYFLKIMYLYLNVCLYFRKIMYLYLNILLVSRQFVTTIDGSCHVFLVFDVFAPIDWHEVYPH